MAKSFQDNIFSAVKGYGYLIKLYDAKGKGPLANPDLAAYMQAIDNNDEKDSIMIRFPVLDSNAEYPKLMIYKSDSESPKFDKLLMTLKQLALKAGYTVTYRVFGKSITPKDMGYAPKAEREAEEAELAESMPSSVIKDKQRLSYMSDKELGEYLKSKSEEKVLKLQKLHALKNNRYLTAWKKANDSLKEAIKSVIPGNIPGSNLSPEDQKLLYWFIEGYTRPNGSGSDRDKREKIYLRVIDGYVEYNDPRFGASHGFSKAWRIVGNEDQLLGMAYNKQAKQNQTVTESKTIKDENKRVRLFAKLINEWIKTSSDEHQTYLDRGNKVSDKRHKILNKKLKHINDLFFDNFKDLMPDISKGEFYLGNYDFSDSSMGEIVNDWFGKPKQVNESKYETYGSTRSSYQETPKSKSRVIIRHSKVVDESKVGARSRSVKTLMVETHTGERRIIPSKSLRGARALSNYVNTGGNIYDETANRIVQLSDDVKNIKKLKKTYPILEGDEDNTRIHQAINEVAAGLVTVLERLNSNKINDYLPMLEVSHPNMVFSETFYKQKLGENHDVGSLARGSIICSRIRKGPR